MPRTPIVRQDGPGHIINANDGNEPDQYLAWLSRGVHTAAEHGAKGDGSNDDSSLLTNTDAAAGTTGVAVLGPTSAGYRVAQNTTLAAGWDVPPGAQFKSDSGKTLTINGNLHAGPYQIFSGAGTVALGPGAARRIHPEWVGAKADNSTDNATPFTAWKALVPARGGKSELQQGVYKTSGALLVPANTHLEGVPGTGYAFGGGDYLSGSCLLWTGAVGGTVLSFFDATLSDARGINVHGGAIASVVGVLFSSDNAPGSKTNALEAFQIYACGTFQTNGYGIKIGSGISNTQADTTAIKRGMIVNCDTGVSIFGSNAGYQTVLEQVAIIGHRRGIELITVGNCRISECDFGGQTAATIADIVLKDDGAGHGGTAQQVMIVDCQTEGAGVAGGVSNPFLLVDASCSPDSQYPITVDNCILSYHDIRLYQTRVLILRGNSFANCNVILAAGAPLVYDQGGNTFNGIGMRNVTDAVTTNGSTTLTSATASFVAGDIGKRICAVGSGILDSPAPGIPLGTTIASVTNGTTVVMDTAATATATGVSVRFDYGYVRKVGQVFGAIGSIASPFHTFSSAGEGIIERFQADGAGANPGIEILNNAPGGGQWQMLAPGTGGLDAGGYVLRNTKAAVNPLYADSNAVDGVLRLGLFGAYLSKGQAGAHRTITASATANANDDAIYLDTTGGAVTLTLPGIAGTIADKRYTVKWIAGAGVATVARSSTDTIDGATSYVIPAVGGAITVQADGAAGVWRIVGKV